jgi:hypothetical protein
MFGKLIKRLVTIKEAETNCGIIMLNRKTSSIR